MTSEYDRSAVVLSVIFLVSVVLLTGVAYVSLSAGASTATTGSSESPAAASAEPMASAGTTTISDCTTVNSSGVYHLGQNITGPNNQTCLLINASDVVLDGNGYVIRGNGPASPAGQPIVVENDTGFSFFARRNDTGRANARFSPLSNVTIRDVTVANWTMSVTFQQVDDATVENTVIRDTVQVPRFLGTGDGLIFNGGANQSVVDSRFDDLVGDGLVFSDTNSTRIVRTTVRGNGQHGINMDTVDDPLVANNTVRNNGGAGIRAYSVQHSRFVTNTIANNGGSFSRGDGFRISTLGGPGNNTVVNNTLRQNDIAVEIDNSRGILVRANTLEQNDVGVRIDGANDSRVVNNTILSPSTNPASGTGITVDEASNVSIVDNEVAGHDTGIRTGFTHGLRAVTNDIHRNVVGLLDRSENSTIARNRIRNNSKAGVELRDKGTTVRRNNIVDNDENGIQIVDWGWADTYEIHYNIIEDNPLFGIENRNDTDAVVDATQNWWGDASGPSTPSGVPFVLKDPLTNTPADGSGDAVTQHSSLADLSNVHFDPWLQQRPSRLEIVTDQLGTSELGQFVTHRFETKGGARPLRSVDVVNGSLPPGMFLHDDGVLNGTPRTAGNFTFTVRATDSSNTTANQTVTKRVVATVPRAALQVEKQSTRAVAGRLQLYAIRVKNNGSTIARNITVRELLEPWFTFDQATPNPDSVETRVTLRGKNITINGTQPFSENLTRTIIRWNISRLRPGESRLLTYQVRIDSRLEVGFPVTGEACALDPKSKCNKKYNKCVIDGIDNKCDSVRLLKATGAASACLGGGPTTLLACVTSFTQTYGGAVFGDEDAPSPCPFAVKTACEVKRKDCLRLEQTDPADLTGDQHLTPNARPPCDKDISKIQLPKDPNEKVVAAERFIQPDRRLPYTVRFENIGNASAQNVTVTDRLSPNLNRSSLEVFTANHTRRSLAPGETVTLLRRQKNITRNVTIGNTTVTRNQTVTEHHTATLDNRTIRWHLRNIYLEPNATGQLLMSVDTVPGLTSGDRIENNATIRFDDVSSLTTNDTVNVVDQVAPSCTVDPLPAESPQNVTISWSGNDSVGRIDTVTIFHSTDGQTWEIAASGRERTNITIPTLTGNLGQTHRFMCSATDVAGNQESETPRTEAETVTKAGVNAKPSVSVSSNGPVEGGTPLDLVVAITDQDTTDSHTLTIDWGDGNTTTLSVTDSNVTRLVTRQYTYAENGTYDIDVSVTDDDGATDSATHTASVGAVEGETVALSPENGSVVLGELTTFEIVVDDGSNGASGYGLAVEVRNDSVGRIVDADTAGNPGRTDDVQISSDNSSVSITAEYTTPLSGARSLTLASVTVEGTVDGSTAIELNTSSEIRNGSNTTYAVGDFDAATLTVGPTVTLPGAQGPARSVDGDPLLEDADGDGTGDVFDAIALYNHRTAPEVRTNPQFFDFDGDGNINVFDAIELYNEVR